MSRLTILNDDKRITADFAPGANLGELLREHMPEFAMPCGGNHKCGKCIVEITDGDASPETDDERRLLARSKAPAGFRLACFVALSSDTTVSVSHHDDSKILSWYKIPAHRLTETGYGFAVDIGTTTIAIQLVNRDTGEVAAERRQVNRQRGYGADVISRIEACRELGVDVLSDLVADQIEELCRECLAETGMEKVEEAVVTGNSTMLHLYEGLDPASIAVSPFRVASRFGCESRRRICGAPVYLPRCVGAYVGPDIICSILASNMTDGRTQLMTDVGTNGEMVISKDGRLTCCATAAGPAFEGAGLSCGMPAAPGAISSVSADGDDVTYEVIGNAAPKGLCGSGILDALAVMVNSGYMEENGYIPAGYDVGGSGVVITQKDVRQMQLAKSAICAGMITLMEDVGTDAEHIDRFSLAGGFGNSINSESAADIGLFPDGLKHVTDFIGNATLGGAYMLLNDRQLREASARLADEAHEISLSESAQFMEHYVDCMSFEKQ